MMMLPGDRRLERRKERGKYFLTRGIIQRELGYNVKRGIQ